MTKNTFPMLVLVSLIFVGSVGLTSAATVLVHDSELLIGGPPSVTVCGKTKGEVDRIDLINMKTLALRGCVESAKIKGFKISVVNTNEDGSDKVIILTTKGDALTEKMKSLIKGIPVGSKVYFEDIEVVDATGKKYDIKPVVVTIA